MKKKRVIIASIAVVLVAVIAVMGMRLLGGSHTGIDNEPEAEVSGSETEVKEWAAGFMD